MERAQIRKNVVRLGRICLLVVLLSAVWTAGASRAWAGKAVQESGSKAQKPGWHRAKNGKYYYILPDGTRAKGWKKVDGKMYYLDREGYRVTGWKKISGKFFYFNSKGVRQRGWVSYKNHKYYCDPKNSGARVTGWKEIGKYWYYFDKKGRRVSGWLKEGGRHYYLQSNGRRAGGWQSIGKYRYYFDRTTGVRAKGWTEIDGYSYYFNKNGRLLKNCYTPDGAYVDAEGKKLKKSTLKEFLQIALKPVGSTMYVWGGGWGAADDGGNIDARTIGVSPQWRRFFNQQNAWYDYRTTRYQSRNGLDCSGFVGWAIYNAFNTKSGNSGYVHLAQHMTRIFSAKGWGTYTAAGAVRNYRAGDIMSTSDGHVYIVIGSCSDGSVVLVHSSPCGVQISGTYTRSGNTNSKAVQLARKYMKKYYPKWYAKYPNCSRGTSYLTRYSQMRWKLTGNCMMSDPDHYADKNAAKILKDLLGKV